MDEATLRSLLASSVTVGTEQHAHTTCERGSSHEKDMKLKFSAPTSSGVKTNSEENNQFLIMDF